MRKRLPIIVRVLLALTLVAGLLAVTAAPASAAAAVTLGNTTGYPGQGIAGNGSDWAPGATITVTLAGTPVTTSPPTIYVGQGSGSAYPWDSGTWSGSIVVPTVPGGSYTGVNGLSFTDGATTYRTDFTVAQLATVSPTAGPVGTSVTITGKGFKDGSSATVTMDTSTPPTTAMVTSPYPIPVAADGTLSATLVIPDTATAGANNIRVTDGQGNYGDVGTGFNVRPSLTLIPNTGMPGSTVTAIGTHFSNATYRIAVQNEYLSIANGHIVDETGTVSANKFTDPFAVPSQIGGAAITPGAKTVRAYIWTGSETPATATEYADATYTVQTLPLTITPSTGVSYTTVTVQGAGFTVNRSDLAADGATLTLGSEPAVSLSGSTDSIGQLTGTCRLPQIKGGTYTLVIYDGTALTRQTTYTIPAAAITVTPGTGPEGTSITVSGTNFVPTLLASIWIANISVGSASVSNAGTFSASVVVPNGVSSGTNIVMATDAKNNTGMASFTVPGASITLSPSSGYAGMTIAVSGTDFPAYSSVTSITFTRVIGGSATVTPIPAPGVGADGTVTTSFIVPASMPGIATVVLTAGQTSGAGVFTVSAAAAVPATVFATLETQGLLVRVYALDAPTQTWLLYDPAAPAEVNDLDQLVQGQGYYVKVTADCTLTYGVNTYSLYAGWNLIGWLG